MRPIIKACAALALGLGLVGCVDVEIDVALTGPASAEATMTQVMNADFYTLIKMNAAEAEQADEEIVPGFCAEGDLTENVDGTATCVITESGPFADLDLGQEQGGITFTPEDDGRVRIAISIADLEAQAAIEEELDAETLDLVNAFFAGRNITLTFGGGTVVDTNMTLAEDEQSASQTIALLDLMNGDADLPEELFAIVDVP